ncbi:MAG: efflux transporter periplasmic adaptor subunit, partial [Sphingomonas bacterium]|nr:efflux transporter periplasmic adaptor subunit [Sphingomonas bacterium]
MRKNLILGLALVATACSSADDTATPEPVALVKLAPVSQGGAAQQLTVYGAAEPGPGGKMSLVAPAEAKVIAIDAPVGSKVGQGQVVVRLAASPTTRSDAAKAAADAAAADKALARATRLRADGLVSDADVETARAAAVAANALRASFASRAGGLTLRAPASGNVETIVVAPGDLLQAGAAVATITRAGDARVRFGVDPDAAQTIRPGMALAIAGNGARAPLTVVIDSVSPTVDPATKLAGVFARIPASSGIVAGETLTATIDVAAGSNALTIPYAALLDDGGQPYVYVVAGGVAHR